MAQEKHIIWSTNTDLSPAGIEDFCKRSAGRYGKTPDDMMKLPLQKIVSMMWDENRSWRLSVQAALDRPCDGPILVIADRAGEMPLEKSERSCEVLSGERLSQVLDVCKGVSTTLYSDGADIHCRDLSETGANYYLFREITSLDGLREFSRSVAAGEVFTESDLSRFSKSLAPKIHEMFGWPAPAPRPFDVLLRNAAQRAADAQAEGEEKGLTAAGR